MFDARIVHFNSGNNFSKTFDHSIKKSRLDRRTTIVFDFLENGEVKRQLILNKIVMIGFKKRPDRKSVIGK